VSTRTRRITTDQIRLELGIERVMDQYGLKGVKRGGWYRLKQCPKCLEKSSSEAIAIQATSGRWLHHGRERNAGGECSGDLFSLVAACEGLDARKDFRTVLDRCAQVAGISAEVSDPESERRIQERLRQREAEERADQLMRQQAAVSAAAYWDTLFLRHDDGEKYLGRRGLSPSRLIAAQAVRFNSHGDICVAIRNASSTVTTVATRHLEPGDRPKVLVRKGTSTAGGMIDTVADIHHGRDVVVVEGVVDALTARLAWPDAVVLGANGAGNIAPLVRSALSRVKLARSRLILVPHADVAGIRAVTAAAQAAVAVGLQLDCDLSVVDLPCPDLNDAWCAGWRITSNAQAGVA
jgi:hypothetical protein